jgi:ferredoxin
MKLTTQIPSSTFFNPNLRPPCRRARSLQATTPVIRRCSALSRFCWWATDCSTCRPSHATADRSAEDQQVVADTFEIYLAWSDTTLTARPRQTALQVLTEASVAVEPGCQTGGCGMCATAFVGETLSTRTHVSARERYSCPCVSRARKRIVLAQ